MMKRRRSRLQPRIEWMRLWEDGELCFLKCRGCEYHRPRDGDDLLCEFCMLDIWFLMKEQGELMS